MPPVIGKLATPALLMVAVPVGAGVSFSVPSAFTKPASRVTAVLSPLLRSGTVATGVGVAAAVLLDDVDDVSLLLEPQAANPKVRTPAVERAMRFCLRGMRRMCSIKMNKPCRAT